MEKCLFSYLLFSSPVFSLSVVTYHAWCEGAEGHTGGFRFVVHHTGGQCERELSETQRVFHLYLTRERREKRDRGEQDVREKRETRETRERREEKEREKDVFTHTIKLELEPETYFEYSATVAKVD